MNRLLKLEKKIKIRRVALTLAFTLAVGLALVCTAGLVWADHPHYLKLSTTLDSGTACYDVDLKEAGLGNSGVTEVTYTLDCTSVTFTTVCVTKNGKNFVQGQPKSGTSEATSSTTIPVRNGQTTGTVELCPGDVTLPDPGCTGSQKLYIIGASYSGCTLDDGLGTAGAGLQDLNSLSNDNLFILVQ